jgi:hypothetical protein
MNRKERALVGAFEESFAAIELLRERRLIQSTLVLVYSTIDAAASLDVSGEGDVKKDDFVRWADAYLIPGSALGCTGLDLYGARCGLLHSWSAFSRLSRDRKVKSIWYAVGPTPAPALAEMTAIAGSDFIGISLDDLCKSLRPAFKRYLAEVTTDSVKWQGVLVRAGMLFGAVPGSHVTGSRERGA